MFVYHVYESPTDPRLYKVDQCCLSLSIALASCSGFQLCRVVTERGPNIGLAGCGISLFSLPGCGMKEHLKAGSGMVRSGGEAGSSSV